MKKDLQDYLNKIGKDEQREDCFALLKILEEESGYEATLHGKIVGFGIHRYEHDTGRSGEAIITGFLPRTRDISVYIMPSIAAYVKELAALGKFKSGKCCLYVRKLADIDEKILRKIIRHSVKTIERTSECRSA